jgi:hypothetical protein
MLIGGGTGFMTGGMGGGVAGLLTALMSGMGGSGGMGGLGNMLGGMRFGNMNTGVNNNNYAYNSTPNYNNVASNQSQYSSPQAIPDLRGGRQYYGNTGAAVTPVGYNSQQANQQAAVPAQPAIPQLAEAEQTQPQAQVAQAQAPAPQTEQQQAQPAPLEVKPSEDEEYIPNLEAEAPPQPRSDVARSAGEVVNGQPAPRTNVRPSPRQNAVTTVPDVLTPPQQAVVRRLNEDERKAQLQPIWHPFYKRFKTCRPDCEPIGYHAKRPSAMCHNNGHALDLDGMVCADGSRHMAVNSGRNSGVFAALVDCMVGQPNNPPKELRVKAGLGGLWHNGSHIRLGHRNHAHFSIGCGNGVW